MKLRSKRYLKEPNLTTEELNILRKLNSPIKIQDFLDQIPINFENEAETHFSPRRVLKENKAHCIEGALLGALALWVNGEEPLIMDLKASKVDFDHVIAIYKKNGYFGAISKTNHTSLRFRDPVYKTLRELALSYFHEYFENKNGKKTLLSYSKPLNLKTLPLAWITSEENLWFIDEKLDKLPHFNLIPKLNSKYIRNADKTEIIAGKITEWKNFAKKNQ